MVGSLRQHFEQDIGNLQQDVLRMGTYVVDMLDRAMSALMLQDSALADEVVRMDDDADRMDQEIEQRCLHLLALQQPMSKDLRIISTALKIITDLERIGDFSVDIAKTGRRAAREAPFQPPADIPRMADCVKALLREALEAYVSCDLDRVRRAIAMDDQVDEYYDRIFTDLLRHMESDPSVMRQAVWFTHIIHFLERIADHSVNVAERVHYMETGEFKQLATSHLAEPGK